MADDLFTSVATRTRAAEGLDRRAFTVDEVAVMRDAGVLGPKERFELIDGEIVPMNSERRPHAVWKSRIAAWLIEHVDRSAYEVIIDSTVQLGPQALFEPDVMVIRKGPMTPDFIQIEEVALAVEVSATTLRRDLDVKGPSYAASGLAELWIVDLEARRTLVSGAGTEAREAAVAEDLRPGIAPGAALRLSDLD